MEREKNYQTLPGDYFPLFYLSNEKYMISFKNMTLKAMVLVKSKVTIDLPGKIVSTLILALDICQNFVFRRLWEVSQ